MYFLPLITENVYFIFYKFSPAQVKLSSILLKCTKSLCRSGFEGLFVSLKRPIYQLFALSLLQVAPSVEYLNSVNDVIWLLKPKKVN